MSLEAKRGLAIAVTGGIACGKSEAGRCLAELGAAVIDADEVARDVVKPGMPALDGIARTFGRGVLAKDGSLDRERLADVVFADAEKRRALEAIVHPPVLEAIRSWVTKETAAGRDAVAMVPLLFEAGAAEGWDAVVCIAASDPVALQRLRARGFTDEEANARMAAQWPVAEKARRAGWTIWNDGTLEVFRSDVSRVYREIRERTDHGG